jgi:hypothetical protein
VLTFHFVCLTWIFFNADGFGVAIDFLKALANTQASRVVTPFTLTLLAVGFAGQFLPPDLQERLENGVVKIPLPLQAAAIGLAVVAIAAFGPGTLAPFIYFKF